MSLPSALSNQTLTKDRSLAALWLFLRKSSSSPPLSIWPLILLANHHAIRFTSFLITKPQARTLVNIPRQFPLMVSSLNASTKMLQDRNWRWSDNAKSKSRKSGKSSRSDPTHYWFRTKRMSNRLLYHNQKWPQAVVQWVSKHTRKSINVTSSPR